MSDTDTLFLPKPKGTLRTALDNEVVELVRKYGVTAVILWQLLGGGIKTSFTEAMREVVRAELAPLEKRIAQLESSRP